MNDKSPQRYTFAKQLTLLFIGLKLTHYIDWSWIWITAPLWIAVTFVVLDRRILNLTAWLDKSLAEYDSGEGQ
jgi:hypothetical protein